MSKIALTDLKLRNLKPAEPGKRYIIFDGMIGGFGVRVGDRPAPPSSSSRAGSIVFILTARFPGSINPTTRRIGVYQPGQVASEIDRSGREVGPFTLEQARTIATRWKEQIRKGIDPKVEMERKLAEIERLERDRFAEERRKQNNTFSMAFDAFDRMHLSTLRTGRVVASQVKKHVIPILGDKQLTEITPGECYELINSIKVERAIGANRLVAYLKKFGRWAEECGRVEISPFSRLKRPSKENRRARILSPTEIRAFWKAANASGKFGRAFQLMLLLGQRRTEVGAMQWAEIDFKRKIWTIPQARTKADREHEVPLALAAIAALEAQERHSAFVFSTRRKVGATESIQEDAPISGWSKAKTNLDKLMQAEMRQITGDDKYELREWKLHDLRRTAASSMEAMGISVRTISSVLNHAATGVTEKHYLHHDFEVERRQALEIWSRKLSEVVARPEGTNVVWLSNVAG